MKPKEIHEKITDLFKKNKLDWITLLLPLDKMQNWALLTSKRLKISRRILSERISELFWSVGYSQLSLGYSLWCLEHCKYPNGVSGVAFFESEIPNAIDIPAIHFCYHLHTSEECLYRCWERITSIVQAICYHNINEKLYFNGLVNKIKNDTRYNINPKLKELSKLEKTWNKVARLRNLSSHQESSPMKLRKIEGKESGLYDPRGKVILCADYSYKNLNSEIPEIQDLYKRLLSSIRTMKEFIDNIQNPTPIKM